MFEKYNDQFRLKRTDKTQTPHYRILPIFHRFTMPFVSTVIVHACGKTQYIYTSNSSTNTLHIKYFEVGLNLCEWQQCVI